MTLGVQEVNTNPDAAKDTSLPGSGVEGLAAPPGSAATIPAGDAVPMWQQEKLGAKCCGCCCDYRRALMVVASIGITLIVISFIVALNAISAASSAASSYGVEDSADYSVEIVVIVSFLGVSASVCALVGAVRFNIWLVVVNVVWLSGKYSQHEQYDSDTRMFSYDMLNLCSDSDLHRYGHLQVSVDPTILRV